MRPQVLAALMLAGLLLLIASAEPVSAGVEPSPFRDTVNLLDRVANRIDSLENRLEPYITNHLELSRAVTRGDVRQLENMMDAMDQGILDINEAMEGIAWSEYQDDAGVLGALTGIRESADGVMDMIWNVMGDPEDGFIVFPPPIGSMMRDLYTRAGWLDWWAWFYLTGQGSGGTGL